MNTTMKKNQQMIRKNPANTAHTGTMEKITREIFNVSYTNAFFILLFFIITSGCKKNDKETPATSPAGEQSAIDMRIPHSRDFEPVNLVADTAGYHAIRIDANLSNAWGLAFSDEGDIWISSNHTGLALIYNGSGQQIDPPVNVPFGGDPNGGAPTGAVYNETNSFIIPSNNEKAEFIYATENGTIAAWSSGNSTITVADRSSSEAVYKGLALAENAGANYIYATNFKGNAIDVFDGSFNYVSMPFMDPGIPAGFAPFGIQNIDGKLYVTYALQKGPDNEDDQSGPGNGYIDIYNPDGTFVSRFASQGTLNSPWGLAQVPGGNHAILVGNFGDGHINVYGSMGNFLGQLKDDGHDIEIEGLWAIAFKRGNFGKLKLYFTAGPDEEEHGLFGFIIKE